MISKHRLQKAIVEEARPQQGMITRSPPLQSPKQIEQVKDIVVRRFVDIVLEIIMRSSLQQQECNEF